MVEVDKQGDRVGDWAVQGEGEMMQEGEILVELLV